MEFLHTEFKVYLDGIEVPADNIVISVGIDQPSNATFYIHPTPSAYKIKGRTIVHISAKSTCYDYELQDTSSVVPVADNQEKPSFEFYPEFSIFEGEIIQKNFMESRGQSVINVLAADYRNLLDTPLMYFLNIGDVIGQSQNVMLENKKVVVAGILGYSSWLKTKLAAYKNDFQKLMQSFFESNENSFYKNYMENRKFRMRFFTKTGDIVRKQLMDDMMQEILQLRIQSLEGTTISFNSIIQSIASPIVQAKLLNFITNLSPPRFTSATDTSTVLYKQFLVIPNLVGIAPPKCNVFFPGNVGSVSYVDSIKFSRASLRREIFGQDTQGDPSKDKNTAEEFWAPKELADAIYAYLTDPKHQNDNPPRTLLKATRTLMTTEEKSKGIYPIHFTIPMGTKTFDLKDLISYVFNLHRFSQNRVTLNECPFNPYPVVGFPALVLLPNVIGMGLVESITHNLGSKRQTSSFVISNFVPYDEITDPPSLLADFFPAKIDDVYQDLLSCNSIMPFDTSAAASKTLKKAIQEVKSWYDSLALDYLYYNISQFNRRDMVTSIEAREFVLKGKSNSHTVKSNSETLNYLSYKYFLTVDHWADIWNHPLNDSNRLALGNNVNAKLIPGSTWYIPALTADNPAAPDEEIDVVREHVAECAQFKGSSSW